MKKTKHHIISEFYQKGFIGDDNKIYYLMPNCKIISSSPYNMLKEEHYNTVRGSLFVEDIFSNVEGYIGLIIKKIKEKKEITKDDKVVLSIYTSIVFNRNRIRRDKMKNFAKSVLNKFYDTEDRNNSEYSKIENADNNNYESGAKISLDDFKKTYENFKEVFAVSSMSVSLDVWEIIYQMKWRFLFCSTENIFLSSDNPVNLCRPLAENKYGFGSCGARAGLAHEDVELTFPLAKNIALLAGWKNSDDLSYVDVPDDCISQINYRTIRNAETIFSGSKKLLESILSSNINNN